MEEKEKVEEKEKREDEEFFYPLAVVMGTLSVWLWYIPNLDLLAIAYGIVAICRKQIKGGIYAVALGVISAYLKGMIAVTLAMVYFALGVLVAFLWWAFFLCIPFMM